MSNVAEHFEALQHHLASGQQRAERLGRLLAHTLDESGRPSVFVLPEARALVSASMIRAADAAADIGIELFDVRWTAVVTLLHNAGTFVRTITAREADAVVALLRGLQVRVVQLRFRRETGEMKVRLS
jgi:hypothetical protein